VCESVERREIEAFARVVKLPCFVGTINELARNASWRFVIVDVLTYHFAMT